VLTRTIEVVERIQAAHEGETVAIATHMGPARMLVSHLAGVPIEQTYEMEFPSTGISIFRLDRDAVKVELLNDGTHVEQLHPPSP
jgi:broad specificity phosphatase PhoE